MVREVKTKIMGTSLSLLNKNKELCRTRKIMEQNMRTHRENTLETGLK